jgi:hypothetical protein
MSNVFQSISSAGTLKNVYQGPIQSQLNDDCAVWRGADKGKEKYSGLQVVRPVKLRRNQGIGATSDGGNLPQIGVQKVVQATIAAKFLYLRAGITGPMIKASQNDVGSFVRGMAFEIEQGYKDFKSDVNRQLSWDGTGDLARVNTLAAGSTTLVIKGREDTEPALKFLDVGSQFDIYNGTSVVQAGITIASITTGTPTSLTATVVCDVAVTSAANYQLVRAGSYGYEMNGLLTALDGGTGTINGIDRSQYIAYQGNVSDNSGGQMTLDYLESLYNLAMLRGGEQLSAIFSDFNSERMYKKLLAADKRFVNTMEGDGGFAKKGKTYAEFNGIPWVHDKDCPQRVFVLPEKVIKKYVLCEMEFADETGSMAIAQTGADQFELRCRFFADLFNEFPASCAAGLNYISP